MKIIAFAASNSRNSINKMLVTHASSVFGSQVDADVEVLDLNDYEAPIFGIDIENELGIPQSAKSFFEKIGQADALLVSYAEHNGSYTAAWKSLFDWMSRIDTKVFQGKPMVVLATSPGKGGAGNVLKAAVESAPHFGAEIKSSLSVPSFIENFDTDSGTLSDEALAANLLDALTTLVG